VVGLGPFSLGLDGVLGWIPGAGVAYSVGARAYLLRQAVEAHAEPKVLARMAALVALDSLTDLVPLPIAPAVVDMVFTGHKWAADALIRHMDETIYYEGTRAEAEADPAFREHLVSLAEARRAGAGPHKRRIVYLADQSSSSSAQ
jgi:hypothetical protein